MLLIIMIWIYLTQKYKYYVIMVKQLNYNINWYKYFFV